MALEKLKRLINANKMCYVTNNNGLIFFCVDDSILSDILSAVFEECFG